MLDQSDGSGVMNAGNVFGLCSCEHALQEMSVQKHWSNDKAWGSNAYEKQAGMKHTLISSSLWVYTDKLQLSSKH